MALDDESDGAARHLALLVAEDVGYLARQLGKLAGTARWVLWAWVLVPFWLMWVLFAAMALGE